jgi:hypothetical protein
VLFLMLWGFAGRHAQDSAAASGKQTTSWFGRLSGSSSSTTQQPGQEQVQQQQPGPSPASGAAAWQQQQQQWTASGSSSSSSSGVGEPLSGAIPLLNDDGLTNHPLDYNPITNEHTAAMTLAKQSGIEAYNAGRCGCVNCTEMPQACRGRARRICARLLNKLLLHSMQVAACFKQLPA